MVEYPTLRYNVTVSSYVSLPVSTVAPPTRSSEAFGWETNKLLRLVEEEVGKPLGDKLESQAIRRIQDKDNRWILIDYTILPNKKDRVPRRVILTLCQDEVQEEFEKRQRAAELLAEKINPILYEVDPMNFSDAPEDEYEGKHSISQSRF